LRLWENVRDLTLQSTAPSLVYEEGNLIKRSIRDLYSKDIDEIQVAGEAAFHEAQDFMRMLSPSQAKHVIKYEEPEALFSRHQIERQLNAMFSPYVTLRSGGYLVINQTEALVSVDVNSGKATREFSIEETALQTNLEAADEVARQVKLRDLAGLIVIDFIDMEERRNNRKVENRLKDALRHDRARIQVGRISHFGLLEMSRQRLRTGVMEGSTTQCPHCQGTGIVRSTESVALAVLRALEDQLVRDSRSSLMAVTTAEVALYILNNKRSFVTEMERRYGVFITVQASERMQGANFAIEKSAAPVVPQRAPERSSAVNMEWAFESEEGEEAPSSGPSSGPSAGHAREEPEAQAEGEADEQERRPRRRRRRGRRDERGERNRAEPAHYAGHDDAEAEAEAAHGGAHEASGEEPYAGSEVIADAAGEIPGLGEQPAGPLGEDDRDERRGRRRRRGRRGGRRGRDREGAFQDAEASAGDVPEGADSHEPAPEESAGAEEAHAAGEPAPAEEPALLSAEPASGATDDGPLEEPRAEPQPEPARVAVHAVAHDDSEVPSHQYVPDVGAPAAVSKDAEPRAAEIEPRPLAPAQVEPAQAEPAHAEPARVEPASEPVESDPLKPARKGWWQRRVTVD
jgi:ribonuclease E